MICKYCNYDNLEGKTLYCTKCGKRIGTYDPTVNFMEPSLKYLGPKKLVRSRNRWIGGVCAGLADYYNVEVFFIRLLFIFLSFIGLIGIILYILLLIFIPESQLDPFSE